MDIIDFHTHCFSEKIRAHAMVVLFSAQNATPHPFPPSFDGGLEGLRASMKRAGVKKSVVANVATKERHVPVVNNWAIESNCDDIISFGSIHPQYSDYKQEIKRLCENGIVGLKFHPDNQDFYIDDKSVYPIFECAAKYNMTLLFHTCDISSKPYTTPKRLKTFIGDMKYNKIVLAHLGGYGYFDEVYAALAGTDVYFDTSFAFCYLTKERVKEFVLRHGEDKLLYGSDAPFDDQAKTCRVHKEILAPSAFDKIMGKNARKLLFGAK